MEVDSDKLLMDAIRDGIREGVKQRMNQSYNNPFDKLITDAIAKHGSMLSALISDSVQSCLGDAQFREQIAESCRHILAKTLVQRFGGELEKQVNTLKSDPATRAKITLAITEIVKERSAALA